MEEAGDVTWTYDGSSKLTPYLKANEKSTIAFDKFYKMLGYELEHAKIDWNPSI